MAITVYVYYRLADAIDLTQAKTTIQQLQVALFNASGIQGSLHQRHDDPALWMEVYANITALSLFLKQLTIVAESHQANQLLAPGQRRTLECFKTIH